MMQTNQAYSRHQRVRRVGQFFLFLIVSITSLTSGQAAATVVNEATDLRWQPATCQANVMRSGSNTAVPDAQVFVDEDLARKVLTTTGFGHLKITSLRGKHLNVHVFRPSQFDPRTGRIWFVMHGTARNAKYYLQKAAPVAERHQVLALVVEFSRENYPNGDAYTLGVVGQGRANVDAAKEGRWRSPLETPYFEIERTFSSVSKALHSRQPGYFIFGHSAGAQFVHRLLTFIPCPRVLGAVAANAGWYTLPTTDERQPPFPYSLRGAAREVQDLRPLLAAPLTILLGTRDTRGNKEDHNLRESTGAMAQGSNRLERGKTYHEAGLQAAQKASVPLAWQLQLAPGAGHEVAEVIASAGHLLFTPPSGSICKPTNSPHADTAQIALQEVLVVPPPSQEDVNRDGFRRPSEEQFVELVNKSDQPVCLAGWSLQTASGRGGHLFQVGQALSPGRAVIVFSGGVPRGSFGTAAVQNATAASGLDMRVRGDVLWLIDEKGNRHDGVSWGDCAKLACARDHFPSDLRLGGSITLSAREGLWRRHKEISSQPLSPGIRSDGLSW